MQFLRDLIQRWWKAVISGALISQIPKCITWLAEQWAGNHIVDLIDGWIRRVNLGNISTVASVLWLWMAMHPIQSALFSILLLVGVFSIETEVYERRKRLGKPSLETKSSTIDRPMIVPVRVGEKEIGSLVRGIYLSNDGTTAAYHISINPVRIGSKTLSFEDIPRIPPSEEGFSVPTLSDTSIVFMRDLKYALQQWLVLNNAVTARVRLTLHYKDASGKQYETFGLLRFHALREDVTCELDVNQEATRNTQEEHATKVEEGALLSAPEPSRIEIRIERNGNNWLWRLRNRELKEIGPCKLAIRDAQSFDTDLGKLREPCGFKSVLGADTRIPAGGLGQQHYFARLEGEHLEIGDTRLTRLPWPEGDSSESQQWLLELALSGAWGSKVGVNWNINLSIRWNVKEKTLEFLQYSSGLEQTS
jgi:hypothetical protein